jgi:flagellar hook-basal body complex protein FliE
MANISPIAMKAYAASEKLALVVPETKSGTNFYDVAKAAFNAHNKMSSEQILEQISVKGVSNSNMGMVPEALRKINQELNVSQKVAGKAMNDEASLMDLSFATNKSKHMLETVVKFRDTLIQSLDKIFNMQI